MGFTMKLSVSILSFMAIFSTIANSFPLSRRGQQQIEPRQVSYSVVLVGGGTTSATAAPSGLLVTVPFPVTKTVSSVVTVTKTSTPTSTQSTSSETPNFFTWTTMPPASPPQITSCPSTSSPSTSASPTTSYASSTTSYAYPTAPYAYPTTSYASPFQRLGAPQPGRPTGWRFSQPSHAAPKIPYPLPSHLPLSRHGSRNGTYHVPMPSSRFLN
ncbi:hypothetical protein I7I53_08322 [Histoplasma capsulatum var. duboisii H88]|uniref:Uncharacterized protein n=3 Tax=Ajellomyces capsulatus TaxID=5037 RepID=A0A8A1LJ08_AJEC8|nr:hypothetical protein I7I53_08322 [Histoplasma capsulatum var. duboisii H88]